MSAAESKASPHGSMPDALKRYWTKGKGAAEIGWGEDDDFYHCKVALAKHLVGSKADINGLCENLHEIATGMSTSEHAALVKGKGGHHPSSHVEKLAADAKRSTEK